MKRLSMLSLPPWIGYQSTTGLLPTAACSHLQRELQRWRETNMEAGFQWNETTHWPGLVLNFHFSCIASRKKNTRKKSGWFYQSSPSTSTKFEDLKSSMNITNQWSMNCALMFKNQGCQTASPPWDLHVLFKLKVLSRVVEFIFRFSGVFVCARWFCRGGHFVYFKFNFLTLRRCWKRLKMKNSFN